MIHTLVIKFPVIFVLTDKINAFNLQQKKKFGLDIKARILEEFHNIILFPKQIFQAAPFLFKSCCSQPGDSTFVELLERMEPPQKHQQSAPYYLFSRNH